MRDHEVTAADFHRGEPLETRWAPYTFATLHPAAILRIPDDEARRPARADLVRDFRVVAAYYQRDARAARPEHYPQEQHP